MRPKLQLQKYRAVLRMQVGPKCPFTMSVRPRRKRRTLAVGREGRALPARTGTRRKRRSFAAFRARARRRRWRDSVGEHRSAGSGPAPSRRPIYLRHSQSPLCLPPALRLQQFVIDGRRPRDVSDVSHFIQGDKDNLARTRELKKSTDKSVTGCRGEWFSW